MEIVFVDLGVSPSEAWKPTTGLRDCKRRGDEDNPREGDRRLLFKSVNTGLRGTALGDHANEGENISLGVPKLPAARGLGLPFLFIALLVGLVSWDKDSDPTGD